MSFLIALYSDKHFKCWVLFDNLVKLNLVYGEMIVTGNVWHA